VFGVCCGVVKSGIGEGGGGSWSLDFKEDDVSPECFKLEVTWDRVRGVKERDGVRGVSERLKEGRGWVISGLKLGLICEHNNDEVGSVVVSGGVRGLWGIIGGEEEIGGLLGWRAMIISL